MQVQQFLLTIVLMGCWIMPAFAQAPLPVPQVPPGPAPLPGAPLPGAAQVTPVYPSAELDRITSPIALYPDPLLAQVLAAATFSDQIPDAARWAELHNYLTCPALTSAMAADRVPWDPRCPGAAALPLRSRHDGLSYAVDPGARECLSNAVAGRHGCRSTKSAKGRELWISAVQSAGPRRYRSVY